MKYAVRVMATVLGILLVVLGAIQLVLGVWFMFDENDLGLGTAGRVIVGLVYGGILGLGMAAAGVFLIRRGVFPRVENRSVRT